MPYLVTNLIIISKSCIFYLINYDIIKITTYVKALIKISIINLILSDIHVLSNNIHIQAIPRQPIKVCKKILILKSKQTTFTE